jgi:exodeoxyribonuclease VII small subunit
MEYKNDGTNLMNDTAAKSASLEKVTFEDALQELEGIVASLERGDVSLDDAISAFERGTQLKSHCQARLEEARMKVEKIKVPGADAAPDSVSNFDMDKP